MQEQNTSYSWLCFSGMPLRLAFVGKTLRHRKVLANAIRYYRKRAKRTQEKLGELADLNPKYIGEVERCEKDYLG